MAIYALVDCNNFYASCERVFNPNLRHRPVVVLSNNDGCVIARSNEAKALNIPMGAPYFQIKSFCQAHKVAVCSSNYALYGDLSRRVMDILQQHVEQVEEYSIDEAFLRFDTLTQPKDLMAIALELRQLIFQWTGIPVSIGLAPTKVLAKVANHIAKKQTQSNVFGLWDAKKIQHALASFPVEDVWGVGRQWAKRLAAMQILTAWELRCAFEKQIRQQFNVVLERIVLELRGQSVLDLEQLAPRQQIVVSRSFGEEQADCQVLQEAATCFATRAAEKLRRQNSVARAVELFIMTNPFSDAPRYVAAESVMFVTPTDSTPAILAAVTEQLKKIYRPGFLYKKLGVRLGPLLAKQQVQYDCFSAQANQKSEALMMTLDQINQRHGKDSLFYASQGVEHAWQMKRQFCSPCYTTRWDELLKVN